MNLLFGNWFYALKTLFKNKCDRETSPLSDEYIEQPNSLEQLIARKHDLEKEGLVHGQAFGLACLEDRIRNWPLVMGDDLCIVIYGDIEPPDADLHMACLRITIHPDKIDPKNFPGTMCAVRATVAIEAKSLAGIQDAIRRINLLLGAICLVEWGNCALGW